MIKKIPNILTTFRAIAAPLFFILFIYDTREFVLLSTIVFVVASFTDFFDGYLARRMNATTEWGAFVDPLADKFLTTSAFIAFVIIKLVPLWMVVIILLRDFATTFLRLVKVSNKKIKTSKIAKFKTTLQMIFIFILLLLYTVYINSTGNTSIVLKNIIYSEYTYYSMLIITFIAIISLIEYFYQLFTIKANE